MRKSEQIDGLYIVGAVILVAAFLLLSSNKAKVDYVASESACRSQAKRMGASNWEFNNLNKECKYQ